MLLNYRLGSIDMRGGGRRAKSALKDENVVLNRHILVRKNAKTPNHGKKRPCSRKVALVPKDDRIGTNFGGVTCEDGS